MSKLTTTIVIVDDHPLFRCGMVQALGSHALNALDEVEVLEAGNFEELQAIFRAGIDVDLVLLGMALPGVSGFSGLLMLSAEHEKVPVIIISASRDEATIGRAFSLGASGFISKSAGIETICKAIDGVLKGNVMPHENKMPMHEDDKEIADIIARLSTLTPQQAYVLSMVSKGLLNKQIAYELNITEATVKAHVSTVLKKLEVSNRIHAVIQLLRLGEDAPNQIRCD